MPAFPWLLENTLDGELTGAKMNILRKLHPTHNLYTDEEVAGAQKAVEGKTEMQALISYLQSLGHALK
jgi:cytochrome c oxidase cbb3-type subunit 2